MKVLDGKLGQELKKRIREAKPMPVDSIRFHAEIDQKSIDDEKRLIEGYASTKDLDRVNDIVEPTAFTDAIKEYEKIPIVTFMHDWRDPIGTVTHTQIDETGLYVKVQISTVAEKVWTLIKEGVLRAFSIGYDVVNWRYEDEDPMSEKMPVRIIEKLKLYEIAVVTIPANQNALFSVAKALQKGTDLVCDDCSKCRDDSQTKKVMPPPVPETPKGLSLLLTELINWFDAGDEEINDQQRKTLQLMLNGVQGRLGTDEVPQPDIASNIASKITPEIAQGLNTLTKEMMQWQKDRAAQGAALQDSIAELVGAFNVDAHTRG